MGRPNSLGPFRCPTHNHIPTHERWKGTRHSVPDEPRVPHGRRGTGTGSERRRVLDDGRGHQERSQVLDLDKSTRGIPRRVTKTPRVTHTCTYMHVHT